MTLDYIPEFKYDLHCHTVRSDGRDTPKELIDNAVELGMKAIAITDHDVRPPKFIEYDNSKIEIKKYARDNNLNLILGDEFSTDTYVDDVHIVGYELNWDNPLIIEEEKRARKSKSEAYRKLCEVLTENGIIIDYENDILKYRDTEGNIKYRDPDEVERKHIFEKIAKKKYANSWREAKIMVRDDKKLNVRRPKIDPIDAIKLIHECGGIAVLAHPYLIDEYVRPKNNEEISRKEYIERLIGSGLDGIEATYTYSKTSYKGNKSEKVIEKEIRNSYQERLLISGGSDYHAGYKKNIENPRRIGDAGITKDEFYKIFKDRI